MISSSFGHSGSHPGQGCFVYSPRYNHSLVMFAMYDEGQGYLRDDISALIPSDGPLSMKNKGLYEDMIRELMRQDEGDKASYIKKI